MLWILKAIFGLVLLEIGLFFVLILVSIVALLVYIFGGRKWVVKTDQ